jgi:hypothetical protein
MTLFRHMTQSRQYAITSHPLLTARTSLVKVAPPRFPLRGLLFSGDRNFISMFVNLMLSGMTTSRNRTDAKQISVRQCALTPTAQCVIGFFDPEPLHLSL